MSNTISLTPTNIDDPGTTYGFAFGINDGGTIACESVFGGANYEFANGTFSTFSLPFPYEGLTYLEGINDLGDLVGSEGGQGFIDSGNKVQTVSAFGDFTILTSINDSGEAVGYASPQTGYIGFTYQDDHVTALHDPLATGGTLPDDINDSGTIVGWYDRNGIGNGFVDVNNSFTTVDDPLGTNTVVEGINNKGEIVGYYSNISVYPNPATDAHGFIDINNSFTTVNFVGNTSFEGLFGVNDSGQVDGVMTNAAGQLEAVTAEVTCFARGTRISTDHGETPVESLRIGDRVHTLHAGIQPIKWIGTRTYTTPFCNHPKILPIRIAAHAIAQNIPSRDLFVSPGHAIALDDALIHAARLINGRTITQLTRTGLVEYFHIEIETHEIIFAEHTPTETFLGEQFRNQFQNAPEFQTLYPGHTAPQTHCLPLLDRGFHLAAILRRLHTRAGITPPAAPGPLAGFIDSITQTHIIGWAADRAAPHQPVILDILAGRTTIGRTIANIPRPDVAAAGFGAGHHGFEFNLPPQTQGAITIRRTADAAPLPHAQTARAA